MRLLLAFLALAAGELIAAAESSDRTVLTARNLVGLNAGVITLLLQGSDGGELAAQVLALPLLTSGDEAAIGLWVECDIETLLSEGAADLSLELYAYVIGTDGGVKAHLSQTIELAEDDTDQEALDVGLRFIGHLDPIGPGNYKLRVLVREPASQRFALRTVELEVPAATDGTSFLSPPVVAGSAGYDSLWLEVHESPHGSQALQEQAHRLWALDGPPAALPVMYAGRDAVLRLLIRHLPDDSVEVGFSLSTPNGELFERLPTVRPERSAIEPEGDELGGVERLTLRVPLPMAPQGLYVLNTSLTTPEGATIKAPSQTVFIADADALPVRQSIARPVPRARRSINLADVRKRKRLDIMSSAYRQILSDLAAGLWEKALVDLRGLETNFVRDLADAPMTLLDEAERVVFSEVQARQPEALIAVLALHLRLHRRFIEERENGLRAHTARMAFDLAERYVGEIKTHLARSLTADALATLGMDLQEARLLSPALKMFERALELDPHNRSALLSLAVGLESLCEYDKTVEALERLVTIDPGFAEARLRLAINLYRTSQVTEAVRLLQGLIDEGRSDWILTLAYQELARIHLDAGRYRAATHVLDQAVRRRSNEGSLWVQLAYALDRSGQGMAESTVGFFGQETLRAGGTSARSRYQAATTHDQGQARQSLLRSATARLPALAQSISWP